MYCCVFIYDDVVMIHMYAISVHDFIEKCIRDIIARVETMAIGECHKCEDTSSPEAALLA